MKGNIYMKSITYWALMMIVAGSVCAADNATPDKRVTYKEVMGKDGKMTTLQLHLFAPPGYKPADTRPAIIFFHGGDWYGGSPSQFYHQCEYLASRGIVAMSAEYRVKGRDKTTLKECVKDGKSAVRWVRQHAKELGIHPDKIAAGGESAGGQIAAATGTVPGFNEDGEDLKISACPNALVLFCPVFDNGPGGYGHNQVTEYWKEFSPLHNINEKTPPTIVFLGTNDYYLPVSAAKKYTGLMTEKGRRCDLKLYDGKQHGFCNFEHKDDYTKVLIEVDRFLASLRFLKGEPTLQNK